MQVPAKNIILIVIIITFIFILAAVFLLQYVNLYNERKRKYIEEKNLMKREFAQQLLQSQLETQVETLVGLGKELHDNVGQLLNSAKLLIGVTQRKFSNAPDTLAIADETLGFAILELRALSKSLNKEWLAQFDFIENLATEIKRINASDSLQIQYSPISRLPLPIDEQIIVFRIVQEALQNAIKHARANKISITIMESPDWLSIILEDDGKGMESNGLVQSGVGILNMQNRTKLLGGTIQWQSSKNGTIVTIQLPVKPVSQ